MTIPYVARHLRYLSGSSAELWKKSMDAIGIRLAIETMKTPDMRKAARQARAKMTPKAGTPITLTLKISFQMLISATAQPGGETMRALPVQGHG